MMETELAALRSHNMGFTQGRGFVGGAIWFATSIASVTCFGLPRRGHRFFVYVDSFW